MTKPNLKVIIARRSGRTYLEALRRKMDAELAKLAAMHELRFFSEPTDKETAMSDNKNPFVFPPLSPQPNPYLPGGPFLPADFMTEQQRAARAEFLSSRSRSGSTATRPSPQRTWNSAGASVSKPAGLETVLPERGSITKAGAINVVQGLREKNKITAEQARWAMSLPTEQVVPYILNLLGLA